MTKKSVGLRLSEGELLDLDMVRGEVPRERWIRIAIHERLTRAHPTPHRPEETPYREYTREPVYD